MMTRPLALRRPVLAELAFTYRLVRVNATFRASGVVFYEVRYLILIDSLSGTSFFELLLIICNKSSGLKGLTM